MHVNEIFGSTGNSSNSSSEPYLNPLKTFSRCTGPLPTMIVETLNNFVTNADSKTVACAIPAAVILFHVLPWLWDPQGIRKYPGPFFAKFSDFWLAWTSKQGHRSEVIHDYHLKYGMSKHILNHHITVLI